MRSCNMKPSIKDVHSVGIFHPPAPMCTFARLIPLVDSHFYGHTSVSLPSATSIYSQYSNWTLKTDQFLFLIQSVLYNLLKLNNNTRLTALCPGLPR